MNETRKCAQCGQEKPIEDFSKSYKTKCKDCVAKNERDKRKLLSGLNSGRSIIVPSDTPMFIPGARMAIATAAMQSMIAGGMLNNSVEYVAQRAVSYADAMLNELSKSYNENNN